MAYVDFHAVPVGNQTAAWLIPAPFPIAQWFPYTQASPANGVLYSIKDQYSGNVYVPVDNLDVVPPQYAYWTQYSPEEIVLTVYQPGERRALAEDIVAPTVIRFEKQ